MRKIDYITGLYRETLDDITASAENWMSFLHSAAYQYKYPFADQILIYAQRPQATACAGIELWNQRFGRWVNRGATGIALIREENGKPCLAHVFDVLDTHHRENRGFDIWRFKPEYEADVMEALQNRFILDDKTRENVSDTVIAASIALGADHIQDYLKDLQAAKEGSYLEELDENHLRMKLLMTVQASVAYLVLARIGLDADTLVGKTSFDWVREFNTPATVNILGSAASSVSEICLREIEKTVRSIEKSVQNENRTFDRQAQKGYNGGEIKENGGKVYGIELQNRKRNEASESGASRTGGSSHREVRSDASEIHEGAPQGNLYDNPDRGQAESVSPRDRRDGGRTDFAEHIPDGTEPWSNRENESGKSDAVGTDDEQPEKRSRGGSAGESDLRIKDSTLPQISDPDILIQIFRHGDSLRCSKEEIVSFLSSAARKARKTEFVRKAYPPMTPTEFFQTGTEQPIGYYADNDGLLFFTGSFQSRTAESWMNWEFVAKLIGALISDHNYLDNPIVNEDRQISLFDTDIPEARTVAESEFREPEDTSKEAEASTEEEIPESEYKLHLGATVYIGKDECDILSLSKDKVELFDGTLIPLELDYETFMRRLRENPMNDSLLKEPKAPVQKEKNKKSAENHTKSKRSNPNIEALIQSIEDSYASWERYMTEGGSDPFWADGVNMNLICNHIISYRKQLEEMCVNGERPDILNRELPPEMPDNYMARADEIREAAGKTLEVYKSNPTYLWCREQAKRIPDKLLKKSVIPNILGYVTGLEASIKNDDLVSMRRHRDPERYIGSFDTCRKEIEKLLPQIEREQMTEDIFSSLMDEDKHINDVEKSENTGTDSAGAVRNVNVPKAAFGNNIRKSKRNTQGISLCYGWETFMSFWIRTQ